MNQARKASSYMEWAKLSSAARFNLATSGLTSVPIGDFPLRVEELEITASGAYGYQPLIERIAKHTGASIDCVVTAEGTSMANHLALATLLEPGDEVVARNANLRVAPRFGSLFGCLGPANRAPAREGFCAFAASVGVRGHSCDSRDHSQ